VYIVYNLDHLGEYESALTVIDGNLAFDPEKSQMIALKGDVLFHSGNLSGPENFYQKLLGMKEPFSRISGMDGLISLYASQGRFEKADTIAQQALSLSTRESQDEWKRYFLEFTAQLDRRNGKSGRALQACEQILARVRETDDWAWQRSALYTRGLVLAEIGRFEEASRTAVALLAMIRKGMNPKLQRLYDHLQGVIELNRGNYTLAIEFIRKALAQSIVSQSGKSLTQNIVRQNGLYEDYFSYSLGEACFRSGRMSEAAAALEQITLAPTGRSNLDYGPCLLLLGRVYQKLGDIKKSQDNYEKFIQHWEICDTRFRPMVDEAKLLIALLKESRST
jgi:tetratricopeptide (TPR) repeat protein